MTTARKPRLARTITAIAMLAATGVLAACDATTTPTDPVERSTMTKVEELLSALVTQSEHRSSEPSRQATQHEEKLNAATPIATVVRESQPLPTPRMTTASSGPAARQGPNGPQLAVEPALPRTSEPAAKVALPSLGTEASSPGTQNGPWPGAHNANPNRQTGLLQFWDPRGRRWSNCTATAINSENRSTVLTAGHCVYNPDPDGNGRVDGNGYWYTNFRFCPGFEQGCKLGEWTYRDVATTNSWFFGTGADRSYDFRDDVAFLVMKPNASGNLVDVVGGQGIAFNQPVGQARYALGYPAADRRWPEYRYDGRDLIYCGAVDRADPQISGTMWMPCTMTGGASGGPWITSPNANWLGYVNSVNSHKPHGGEYMSGPYFDTTESSLFQYWRNR
jgi:hypothetical protein